MSIVFDAAREFLTDAGLHAEAVDDSIYIHTGDPAGRWTARLQLAQGCFVCTSSFPVNVPADRRRAVADLLARLTWGLLIGNWEMDPFDGEVRYRTSVPARSCEFTPDLARDLVYTNFGTFGGGWHTLLAVITRAATAAGARRRRPRAGPPSPDRRAFDDVIGRLGLDPAVDPFADPPPPTEGPAAG